MIDRIPEPLREGRIPFGDHETWYRITGGENATKPPLVILHGGPGMAHNYVLHFALLAAADRAVIHYDQLGCGNSTHLPDQTAAFWTVDLFLAELENLLQNLEITSYHLLGQSWGACWLPSTPFANLVDCAP